MLSIQIAKGVKVNVISKMKETGNLRGLRQGCFHELCICSEQQRGSMECDIHGVNSIVYYCKRDFTVELKIYCIW